MNIAFIGLAASLGSTGVIAAMANIAIARVTAAIPDKPADSDRPESRATENAVSQVAPHGTRVDGTACDHRPRTWTPA